MTEDEVKQVIVIRADLNMRKGKACAQTGHSVFSSVFNKGTLKGNIFQWTLTPEEMEWVKGGQPKIVLGVDSEEDLLEIQRQAESSGLNCVLITDHGRTEFHGQPTLTCLAIGPHKTSRIDPITRNGSVKTRLM